ncbi:hypothetical protein HDZ31DRAFT_67448 [Schizophyllum fasciatum]
MKPGLPVASPSPSELATATSTTPRSATVLKVPIPKRKIGAGTAAAHVDGRSVKRVRSGFLNPFPSTTGPPAKDTTPNAASLIPQPLTSEMVQPSSTSPSPSIISPVPRRPSVFSVAQLADGQVHVDIPSSPRTTPTSVTPGQSSKSSKNPAMATTLTIPIPLRRMAPETPSRASAASPRPVTVASIPKAVRDKLSELEDSISKLEASYDRTYAPAEDLDTLKDHFVGMENAQAQTSEAFRHDIHRLSIDLSALTAKVDEQSKDMDELRRLRQPPLSRSLMVN